MSAHRRALPRVFHVLLLVALFAILVIGQTSVNQVDGPPSGEPVQSVYVYSGSTVVATCWSPSIVTNAATVTLKRATTAVAISAVSKANPAVVTSAGHGFDVTVRPLVTIVGATGTGWTAINASWTATVIDANTFSIPIDSTLFGTLAGTVTFTTTAPRTVVAEWAVQLFNYVAGIIKTKTWLGGSNQYASKCSDATSNSVNEQ